MRTKAECIGLRVICELMSISLMFFPSANSKPYKRAITQLILKLSFHS